MGVLLFLLALLSSSGRGWAQEPLAPVEDGVLDVLPLTPLLAPIVDDPVLQDADAALQVVDLKTGDQVYALNPDKALNPASVMKVLTSATALHTLGTAWRFRTSLLADGEVNAEGVLQGDLYVRGTGDPTLVVEKLWKLQRDLELAGIVEIDGDVVFDDSYFDDDRLIRGWRKPVDVANGPAYFAPLGALVVNYDTACLVVAPGAEAGEPARVELETPSDVVDIVNELVTTRAGTRPWYKIERSIDEETGHLVFTLTGKVPVGTDVDRYYRAVHDPLAWTMSVFKGLLQRRGLLVSGRFRPGVTPASAVEVASLLSPPLSEILNNTNKYSSNFMAEQVLKALGAQVYGAPGSTEKGLRVVGDYLDSIGISRDDYVLVNGSGLSRGVWLRPTVVNAVLLDMDRDHRVGPEFRSSLAIAGVDGTLRRRFTGEDEIARLRGKTGSLDGVFCLAGYVESADGHTYAFTFLVNGFRRSRPVRALHDRFGEALLAMGAAEAVPGAAP